MKPILAAQRYPSRASSERTAVMENITVFVHLLDGIARL
jgi:hypothetical protein